MTGHLRHQAARLAGVLVDLKLRVRLAVADELARAVGGAVQQVVEAVVAGRGDPPRPPDAHTPRRQPQAKWDAVKGFSHDFARAMEQAEPDRYTATLSKKARTGKIFIDYLRNGRGSTTVAPYSSRAKKGATVSMPVTWKEIEDGVMPNAFPIGDETTRERVSGGDPWEGFFKKAKALKLG